MSDIILSICIPTYNRGQSLFDNVKKWLQSDNKNFEIVIADNCSMDNTVELLKSIEDSRLKIIENDKNYGSYVNGKIALAGGTGKYVMFMTDKDFLDIKNIDKVIDILSNLDVAAGRFFPDCKDGEFKIRRFTGMVKKLSKFCFCGNHPSGFFFDRKLLVEKNIYDTCLSYDEIIRSYLTDFQTTLCCECGDAVIIKFPFVYPIKPPFKNLNHSHTYSLKNKNLFFSPENRFKIFEVYLDFLKEIKLSCFDRYSTVKFLVRNCYRFCTTDYINALNNKNICDWYGVSQEFVNIELNRDMDKLFMTLLYNTNSFKNKFEHTYAFLTFILWYFIRRITHLRRKV